MKLVDQSAGRLEWRSGAATACLTALAVAVGALAAFNPRVGLAMSVAFLLLIVIGTSSRGRSERVYSSRGGALSVEVPVLFLLLATLVFRIRPAHSLAEDPFDPAAAFRMACVMAAALLAIMSLLGPREQISGRITTLPVRIYALYVMVVFAGVLVTRLPLHTAYRGFELGVAVLVVTMAYRKVGSDALPRMEAIIFWFATALVLSAWMGVALRLENSVLMTPNAPIPVQIRGAMPAQAQNTVGFLGVLLLFWSVARMLSKDHRRRLAPRYALPIASMGMVTLVGTQYRTGYAALLVGTAMFAIFRGSRLAALVLIGGCVGVLAASGFSDPGAAQELALRGQPLDRAAGLSGRVLWWGEALEVWRQSPWLGTGLLTGTRFDALVGLGRDTTSTIHSTWIEALAGTGAIGLGVLLLGFVIVWWRVVSQGVRHGTLLPAILLAIMTVRSVTGSSFDIFGLGVVLYLVLAMGARDSRPERSVSANGPRADAHAEASLRGP